MIRLLICMLCCATPAFTQSLPDRFGVSGVAANDTLNIRSGPGVQFDKIGEFGPYTLQIEVLRVVDGWGLVPAGERNGWVSMQFLAQLPHPEFEVPRPLICSGTEPFWTFALHPRGAEYDSPETGRRDMTVLREMTAQNGYLIEAEEGPTLIRTLDVNALPCNDGMSDRSFGMTATLFNETPEGNAVQTGCCTFQVD